MMTKHPLIVVFFKSDPLDQDKTIQQTFTMARPRVGIQPQIALYSIVLGGVCAWGKRTVLQTNN